MVEELGTEQSSRAGAVRKIMLGKMTRGTGRQSRIGTGIELWGGTSMSVEAETRGEDVVKEDNGEGTTKTFSIQVVTTASHHQEMEISRCPHPPDSRELMDTDLPKTTHIIDPDDTQLHPLLDVIPFN